MLQPPTSRYLGILDQIADHFTGGADENEQATVAPKVEVFAVKLEVIAIENEITFGGRYFTESVKLPHKLHQVAGFGAVRNLRILYPIG